MSANATNNGSSDAILRIVHMAEGAVDEKLYRSGHMAEGAVDEKLYRSGHDN
ncbi:hypothetical protein [Cronobacter sakazakii]|uniref:hypothetical protein n=1 Tax=Cronobacter sakazakii TaxID=28141 RepID=UPI0029CA1A57|nr:hypothetical protein [Cronobacter sakazakii]